MSRTVLRFWGSALAVTVLFAAATALLLPYEWLEMESGAERRRGWLLCVWTAGVFSMLFGLSTLLGAFSGLGFRDVHEAGSVAGAVEKKHEQMRGRVSRARSHFHDDFGWWLVSTGALLVLTYFVAWGVGEW